MIELIFVIIVVGILAIIAIPKLKRNSVLEAADQIISHIRYTQHLAMIDHKFDSNDPEWYKGRWTIEFTANQDVIGDCGKSNNCLAYHIYSDKRSKKKKNIFSGSLDSPDEPAKDPQNPSKYLTAGWSGGKTSYEGSFNKNLNIEKIYGINDIEFSKSCGGGKKNNKKNKSISFDEKGRPMQKASNGKKPSDQYLKEECNITIFSDKKSAVITIYPETGYVKLTKKP
nr:type II secretion system protein [Campylobacter portucalensis]